MRALNEPLALKSPKSFFYAPHFVNYIRRNFFGENPPPIIKTTLDLDIQQKVENIVAETVDSFRDQGLSQAAVLLVSLPKGEILAWVGSADFFGLEDGQNDGVIALRQPGSALKPFLYAKAFDKGLIRPATLLDDRAIDYQAASGSFSPRNYSGAFHGPVSARVALASSLNLPAISLAAEVGLSDILDTLHALGLNTLTKEADYYGLGLVLGGGDVTLFSLASAYRALASGGLWQPLIATSQEELESEKVRVFSPMATFMTTDILMDKGARATGFGVDSVLNTPYPAVVKTGTSKNFRDNWALGFTDKFLVAVWGGNFSGAPMNQVSGVTGAGLIWRKVSDLLAEKFELWPITPPQGIVFLPSCP
ncbi:MAG: penicillin-binding transpeptidase domain-containing protein, partial [Candidatus Adiutrix sp.]